MNSKHIAEPDWAWYYATAGKKEKVKVIIKG
jgi:hypothetical protein